MHPAGDHDRHHTRSRGWSIAAQAGLVALTAAALTTCIVEKTIFRGTGEPSDAAGASDAAGLSDAAGTADAPPAACVPAACAFGCDPATNACKDGKLWLFKTSGAYLGNAFGGTAVPPNVRGGADAACLATYTASFGTRSCAPDRVHAVLRVDDVDSLERMATTFDIPSEAPVHRADDDVRVVGRWPDLIDPTKPPLATASTATTEFTARVWTGATPTATCGGWTSTGLSGSRGYTNRAVQNWLGQEVVSCANSLAGLLCVCW
jgi:hypothetical protein